MDKDQINDIQDKINDRYSKILDIKKKVKSWKKDNIKIGSDVARNLLRDIRSFRAEIKELEEKLDKYEKIHKSGLKIVKGNEDEEK